MAAHEVVALLRSGEISAPEVLEDALARIEAVDGAINAMVTRCPERAREAARAVQGADRLGRDHPGWLGGLPVGIKDLTPVAGVRTTYGTTGFADHVPDASDPLVETIEARGGVVAGKTNTPEFGAGANTFNAVFGATRNPWDTRRNAGGSSGGAAASLAVGQTWLSHGSDLAGSLRTPAAYCGIVGLRPSPGRVGGGPAQSGFNTEPVQGPMARSVRDCALFLDTMAGFDPRYPLSFPAPRHSFQQSVLEADEKVRIVYSADLGGVATVAPWMDAHLRRALERVAAAGGEVAEGRPDVTGLDRSFRVLRGILWATTTGRQPEAIQRHFKPSLRDNIAFAHALTIEDVASAQLTRSRIYDAMCDLLSDFDVLACPVVGLAPQAVEQEYPTEVAGVAMGDYLDWLRFAFLATTAGLPAISVPVGRDDAGMPVGLQLIGGPRQEARLLQVARAVEVAMGGTGRPIDPIVTH